jgi:RNA polymerase sigma-70 factor (ECF subfamily)
MAAQADFPDGEKSLADLSDDDLMALYCDGTPEAFDLLFGRWATPVYNFARMLTGDDGQAEDILQETFLSVVQAAHRYQPRGRFSCWLMRIVRNKCLNRIESERLRRETTVALRSNSSDPVSPEPEPVEHLEIDEGMDSLRAAISRLPARQREAIVLYGMEQMSYEKIALTLEVPVNTVKTLIHRARATLAQTVDREDEGNKDAV